MLLSTCGAEAQSHSAASRSYVTLVRTDCPGCLSVRGSILPLLSLVSTCSLTSLRLPVPASAFVQAGETLSGARESMKLSFKTAYRLLVNLQEELADADVKVSTARKAYDASLKDLRSATKRGRLAPSPASPLTACRVLQPSHPPASMPMWLAFCCGA